MAKRIGGEKKSIFVNDSVVAAMITEAINRSPKTQIAIAKEVGFETSHMITLMKQGRTKVPLSKVSLLAAAIDLDERILLIQCLEEYQPAEWGVIKNVFGL